MSKETHPMSIAYDAFVWYSILPNRHACPVHLIFEVRNVEIVIQLSMSTYFLLSCLGKLNQNLETDQSLSYKNVNQFQLNLLHPNSKKLINIQISTTTSIFDNN